MKEEIQERSMGSGMLRSMVFPIITGALKIVGARIASNYSGGIGPLETYLMLSGMVDVGEGFVRTYILDELGGFTGKSLEGETCSFLEKHILYDLPKYAIKKLRRK